MNCSVSVGLADGLPLFRIFIVNELQYRDWKRGVGENFAADFQGLARARFYNRTVFTGGGAAQVEEWFVLSCVK